uniref:Protein kinase domain-containing protein n=1 Tax=Fusarium oxysporum (strain Fo5176) TaxID=660025 RepID=A0A0D2XZB6_FUSOF
MDEDTARASQESPAAYLHLVDTRSEHQSQLWEREIFKIGRDPRANKYHVNNHCLGQGAEAVVCLANDVQTKKQLVCKLINLDKIQGKNPQEDIRRKFQEADILRQLRHNLHRVVISCHSSYAMARSRNSTHGSLYVKLEFAAGGQAHTAAVDIWSLGVVALLLLASDNHDTELNKMGQGDIIEYLTRLFNGLQTKPSLEGIEFVWNCLKVDPLQRINAYGAKTHAWLCSPKKNRELFKRMDSRTLASWKPQDKLKPMPWVLPDLAPSNPPTPTRSPGSSISQYFTTTPTRFETTTTKSRDRVLEIAAEPDPGTATRKTTSSFSVPPRPSGTLRESATSLKKSQPPWQGFRKPNGSANTEFPSKRRRVPRARTHDTANLPLPGLERHLRSPTNTNPRYRQNVLSALERTKSKFLTDSISPVPRTPLDALTTSALVPPSSPKKRKSKRDVRLKGSVGANMRHPSQLTFR